MDTAALRLRDSILTSAETEGLTYQAYWLSTTLALGAFLKARLLPSLRPPCRSAPETSTNLSCCNRRTSSHQCRHDTYT